MALASFILKIKNLHVTSSNCDYFHKVTSRCCGKTKFRPLPTFFRLLRPLFRYHCSVEGRSEEVVCRKVLIRERGNRDLVSAEATSHPPGNSPSCALSASSSSCERRNPFQHLNCKNGFTKNPDVNKMFL